MNNDFCSDSINYRLVSDCKSPMTIKNSSL